MSRTLALPLAGLISLVLAACGGGGEDTTWVSRQTTTSPSITVGTPSSIAQESADDYDQNVSGVISASTLKRWKDDWLTQRPAGITGNLVILQVSKGPSNAEYIEADGANVFTYLVPSASWTEDRDNGVIVTQAMVLSGAKTDALLKKYAIDPNKDLVVCAHGTGSASNAMAQGRCWYTLRYWGVAKTHLALLNGGNQYLAGDGGWSAGDFQASPSADRNTRVATVKDLLEDNTAFQATTKDIMDVVTETDANDRTDGVFLWDARSCDQFSAGLLLETGAPSASYDYTSSFQNGGSRQGHPRGAVQLQYTNLLVNGGADGRYKSKAELKAYLDGETGCQRQSLHRRQLRHARRRQCLSGRRCGVRVLRNRDARDGGGHRQCRDPGQADAHVRRFYGRMELAVAHPGQERQLHPAGRFALAYRRAVLLPGRGVLADRSA
ncbi:hypothetical protein [Candidatus Dactylopiibacterium carminicum]|uniref:hypothetical protein n=1 Tax=Candidatus Dactylopiibacterium carminicum TaxID=857335 RepID=UPI001CC28EC8|nr:hypothetical protein [Candidatus Dactylopiibacterium carminicum]